MSKIRRDIVIDRLLFEHDLTTHNDLTIISAFHSVFQTEVTYTMTTLTRLHKETMLSQPAHT